MSSESFSPDKKQLTSVFFILFSISLILSKQSESVSSSDSSLASSYMSLRFCNSSFELLNNSIIVSKCFFSLTIFFTLLLSFQKLSFDIIKFKLSNFF